MQTAAHQSIDATRAALCALSWASSIEPQPTHTLRLSHLARAIYPGADSVNDLLLMEHFGEACKLGNGYWLPVRPSLVRLEDTLLIVAPNPLSELRRRIAKCDHARGLLRVCGREVAPSWPEQTVDHWTRRPIDLVSWTRSQMATHRARLVDTRADDARIEFYSPHSLAPGRTRWIPLAERQGHPQQEQLLLLRERSGGRTVRHFVGECEDSSLRREATLECDLIRLQFGLEKVAGATHRVRARREASCLWLRFSRPLPREERKFLVAACEIVQGEKVIDVAVPQYAESACRSLLSGLGVEIGAEHG
jgi:hypothetical protein